MAAANILTVDTTQADSADVVIATATTVCLKDAAGPNIAPGAYVTVLLKDDAGQYFAIGELTNGKPYMNILAPGTYRFSRPAGVACGVFSA